MLCSDVIFYFINLEIKKKPSNSDKVSSVYLSSSLLSASFWNCRMVYGSQACLTVCLAVVCFTEKGGLQRAGGWSRETELPIVSGILDPDNSMNIFNLPFSFLFLELTDLFLCLPLWSLYLKTAYLILYQWLLHITVKNIRRLCAPWIRRLAV